MTRYLGIIQVLVSLDKLWPYLHNITCTVVQAHIALQKYTNSTQLIKYPICTVTLYISIAFFFNYTLEIFLFINGDFGVYNQQMYALRNSSVEEKNRPVVIQK